MGSSQSVQTPDEYDKAKSSFNNIELNYYEKLFHRLSIDVKNKTEYSDYITWDSFETNFGQLLDKNYQRKFFDAMCSTSVHHASNLSRDTVSKESFIINVSKMLKGGVEDKSKIFMILCETGNERGASTVRLDEVIMSIEHFAASYSNILQRSPIYKVWNFDKNQKDPTAVNQLVEFYAHELHKYLTKSSHLSDDQLTPVILMTKWLEHQGCFVLEMTCATFSAAFEEILPSGFFTFPLIPTPANNEGIESMLNLNSLLLLSNHIASSSSLSNGHAWHLLYSSGKHGESFTNMLKAITDEGPLLVLVREKHSNYVFGGYSSFNVNVGPNFFGNEACFIFTLHPYMRVFDATGFNNNYVYFNAHQSTMPNGLGFGGRLQVDDIPVHFFALWIDQDFGKGKSQGACSTFSNTQLSANENFAIDSLEIWAVGQRPDITKRRSSKSVLDSNPEMKAILEMTGRGPVSEGLREDDATADIPEGRRFSP